MFKSFYRKILLKTSDDYQSKIDMLLYDELKIDLIVAFVLSIFAFLPIALCIETLIERLHFGVSIVIIIFIAIIYLCLINRLMTKGLFINNFLFTSIYTFKGNAILSNDFKEIKRYNKNLYNYITTKKCKGLCFQICFYILDCLKKGNIKFVAIRVVKAVKCKEKYTIHVLYVNNDWCFDVFTRKQYLLEELLEQYEAIEYKSFSYEDIKGKTYEEFKKDNFSALKDWCKENNCHIKVV